MKARIIYVRKEQVLCLLREDVYSAPPCRVPLGPSDEPFKNLTTRSIHLWHHP